MNELTTKVDTKLSSILSSPAMKARFEQALGKRANQFAASIISAVQGNKYLMACDPQSVVNAALVAAALDLPIDPNLGFSYIVPYKNMAQFQIGWKGFVQLAVRSGQYKTINACAVKEGQLKRFDPFTGEIELQPKAVSDKSIGYLLYFKLTSGYEKYFYMTKDEMSAHALRYSQAYKSGYNTPWKDDFDAMGMKTVVKLGLSKWGILSVDLQKAIEVDQAEVKEDGRSDYIDTTSRPVTPEPIPDTTKAPTPEPEPWDQGGSALSKVGADDREDGSYVIRIGKNKGKSLSELGRDGVVNLLTYLKESSARDGKELLGGAKEFAARAELWLQDQY